MSFNLMHVIHEKLYFRFFCQSKVKNMNISKPTAVKHNIHGFYDKNIGDVLCTSNTLFTCDKQMIISGPTQVKHNIHGFFDSITGQVVISHPKMKAS